jgi:hypothetical protein
MTTTPGLPPIPAAPFEAAVGPVAAGAGAPARERSTLQVLAAWGALAAFALSLVALGWGFTQWSSAKDWRSRAQKTEAQFDRLEARATKAERLETRAERANASTRKQLVASEKKVATLADQIAFTKDVRTELCEIIPGLPASERARICP